MDAASSNSSFKATAACVLGAVLLAVLPASSTAQLRNLVRSALQPGQTVLLSVRDHVDGTWTSLQSRRVAERDQEVQDLAARVRAAEFQARQSDLARQELQRQLDEIRRNGTPLQARQTAPLLSAQTVELRVLGHEILAGLQSRRLLDQGQESGLQEDQWVLDSGQPILDAGSDLSLRTGLPVFAGRCIVGRVAQTGLWTSSLQLITASDFRARAVIADSRGRLLESSPQGLLEGTGSGCRLTQIPATEDVQVGDAVYSVPGFPVDAAMLFGVVTSRTQQPGALHWDVEVKPHADLTRLQTVQVLTPSINPQRLAERN